jgi:hypothetical protein
MSEPVEAPTWEVLMRSMEAANPPALRGTFVDRGREMDVAFRPPFSYRVNEEGVRLEVTDGESTVIADAETVTKYATRTCVVNNNLRGFIHPRRFLLSGGDLARRAPLKKPETAAILGRSAWIASVSGHGHKPALRLSIDSETGMILEMETPDEFAGFAAIEFGVVLSDELFTWEGRIDYVQP